MVIKSNMSTFNNELSGTGTSIRTPNSKRPSANCSVGPAAVTMKDCLRLSWPAGNEAYPPNACKVIAVGRPYLRTINACPSSCTIIEMKPAMINMTMLSMLCESLALRPPPISAIVIQNHGRTRTGILNRLKDSTMRNVDRIGIQASHSGWRCRSIG